MERSPIYITSIFPKNKILIEKMICKNLKFEDWELKLYLNAKKIEQKIY